MERNKKSEPLSSQMKKRANAKLKEKKEFDGNFETVISTGSTLLDLSISGKRIRGGGIPGGVLVEAFGPSQSGKTALLCEMAGDIERKNGENQFQDPEARLDNEFANIFGVHIKKENYYRPDTVTEVFERMRAWEPTTTVKNCVHGLFVDSLAALSTKLEMEDEDGDKMGMRRAKEFSEQLRKTCRIIKQKNYLMVCSNQIRVNTDGNKYNKFTTPGGEAVKFYASIRLKFSNPEKIYKIIKIAGKENKKVIGVQTEIEVVKTVDEPYRKTPLIIIYGYGIDDVRANLQYIKDHTKNTMYCVNDTELDTSMEKSIQIVEKEGLVLALKEQTIDLWEEIESKFKTERKPKR
jgi:recombination protein RecA